MSLVYVCLGLIAGHHLGATPSTYPSIADKELGVLGVSIEAGEAEQKKRSAGSRGELVAARWR